MMRNNMMSSPHVSPLVICVVISLATSASVTASDAIPTAPQDGSHPRHHSTATVAEVRGAYNGLAKWLASSSYGPGWHAHLISRDLEQQLRLGDDADA